MTPPPPPPPDDDLPSDLEVWAQHTYRRILRQAYRDLYAEFFHLYPTLEMKELLSIVADQRMDESHALRSLIEAADRPPRAAAAALAIAVASPWAGDRLLVTDRPQRRAPDFPGFTRWIDRHLPYPEDSTDLPAETGPLAFARHHRLAVPLDALGQLPHWLTGPAMRGGWVCRPPSEPCPSGDGRLLMLGVLVDAVPVARRADPAVGLAIVSLIEWFAGPRAAIPTPGLSAEHRIHRWDPRMQQGWLRTALHMNTSALTALRGDVLRPIPPGWTPPPPTPEQAAAARERADDARRREAAREYALARPRVSEATALRRELLQERRRG